MAQLFHFLGKQSVHLSLQGACSPLAVVEDRSWRQHRRRLQAAQTAEAVAAAAVTEQESFIYVNICQRRQQRATNSTIVGGCLLLPTEVGPTVRCEAWCRRNGIGGTFAGNAAGPGGLVRCVSLRSEVLGTQSLPGFRSGERESSKESLGWALKLVLRVRLGFEGRLLQVCLVLRLSNRFWLSLSLDGRGLLTSSLSPPIGSSERAFLHFLNLTLSFTLWTLFRANHTGDAVGGHPHPAWTIKCNAGKHPWLHVQRVMKTETTGSFQRFTHGTSLIKTRALTFTLLWVKSSICVRVVPCAFGWMGCMWIPIAMLWWCELVRGGSRGLVPVLRLSFLAGTLWAVVLGVNGNLWKALPNFGLASGGCAGSAAQEVGTKRVLTVVLYSSMAVQGSLLWVSVKQPFYAAGYPGLTKEKKIKHSISIKHTQRRSWTKMNQRQEKYLL